MFGLGKIFNEYRTKYRITLREISEKTGIIISDLANMEHEREFFTPEIIRKIQNAIRPDETYLIDKFQKACSENSSKAKIDGQEVDVIIFVSYGKTISLIRDNDIFVEGNLSIYKYALTKVAEKYLDHCEFCYDFF